MNRTKETRVMLIRLSLAAVLLATFAAPAAAAQADDTFKDFKLVCGDTRADYAAATAAAAQHGWQTSDVMAGGMPGVTVIEKQGRKKTLGDASLVLSMTHGTAAKDPSVNVFTCTLQTDRGGYPQLKELAQAWLGFDPASTTEATATYRFTEENGTLRAAAASEFDSAAAGTGMQILTIKRDGGNAILDYVKIKK